MKSVTAPSAPRTAVGGRPAADDAQARTRERVVRTIHEQGPQTALALAERLGLTAAAVRRHLDALLAEGVLEAREPRVVGHRGRGRPARAFALTDAGRSAFHQAYDDLASSALRFLGEQGGEALVAEFARLRVGELERRYAPLVAGVAPEERAATLARVLADDGYAAAASAAPHGEQLCQHHCPVAHVAAEFPQLCEAETEAFGRLLGAPVQRLATIAHGDGVCTTHVSRAAPTRTAPDDPTYQTTEATPAEGTPA